MKKRSFVAAAFLALAILCGTNIQAQDNKSASAQDVKGKNFVNAGVGIGTFGFSGTGGVPLVASYERGITDKISAGVYVGMIKRNWYGDVKYNYKVIGVRGSYHFNELLNVTNEKLDVYGGASIYYRGYSVKYDGINGKEKATSSTASFALHAAARYMFTPNIGAFGEVGYGVSPLQLGATFVF